MKKYIVTHVESKCHGSAVERYEFDDGIWPEKFDVCLKCGRICEVRFIDLTLEGMNKKGW